MARGYLNNLSFPAATLDEALSLLERLRSGIAGLMQRQLMDKTIMCSWRVAQLPLTADYETLREAAVHDRGRFRDTILFFLNLLDQRSPVTVDLSESDQVEADPHIVDGLGDGLEAASTLAVVACALDQGLLLSIGSADRWRRDRVPFTLLTEASGERQTAVDNVCDDATGATVAERLAAAKRELVFENWDEVSGGALRSGQMIEWFEECRTKPGLEQVIMRSVALAFRADYRADGDFIKKLAGSTSTLFEVRIRHGGTNNVRLLFSRNSKGRAVYGYGGTKTAGNSWYDRAIPQALGEIAKLDPR